jgi:hypothetical protein
MSYEEEDTCHMRKLISLGPAPAPCNYIYFTTYCTTDFTTTITLLLPHPLPLGV